MFLKLFLNAMIKNITIYNILDIIVILKSIEPNKITHYIYIYIHLSVFYEFSKFDESKKIKMWCF